MTLPNFHTHTSFCDGADSPEDMIVAAIELGMMEIGFSAHSPIVGEGDWCMTDEKEALYYKTVTALKEKYKDKIKVFVGIEEDFVSNNSTTHYDYIIGSAHVLVKEGHLLSVDTKPERIKEAIGLYYGGDPYS